MRHGPFALALVLASGPAFADPWSWAPIRDGATRDAHLARCDLAPRRRYPFSR